MMITLFACFLHGRRASTRKIQAIIFKQIQPIAGSMVRQSVFKVTLKFAISNHKNRQIVSSFFMKFKLCHKIPNLLFCRDREIQELANIFNNRSECIEDL